MVQCLQAAKVGRGYYWLMTITIAYADSNQYYFLSVGWPGTIPALTETNLLAGKASYFYSIR